jgi:hypothetical protein
MKKLLVGVAAVPFLASVAMAGQPVSLSDTQMDKVTAGQGIEYNALASGIEVLVNAGGGFPIAFQSPSTDPHNFGFNIAAGAEPGGTFDLTHVTPIGPWIAGDIP